MDVLNGKNNRRIKFGVGERELWKGKISIWSIHGLPIREPFGEGESIFYMEIDVDFRKRVI